MGLPRLSRRRTSTVPLPLRCVRDGSDPGVLARRHFLLVAVLSLLVLLTARSWLEPSTDHARRQAPIQAGAPPLRSCAPDAMLVNPCHPWIGAWSNPSGVTGLQNQIPD